MSKEFDLVLQSVIDKRVESKIKARQQLLEKEERQKSIESAKQIKEESLKKKSEENKKIFEDAGIVNLFQEIIDSGVVKFSNYPLMSKGHYIRTGFLNREKWVPPQEVLPYTPAIISWGRPSFISSNECDNEYISLIFNSRREVYNHEGEERETYDSITFYLTSDRKIGIHNKQGRAMEVTQEEIPEYIAQRISETTK